MEKRRGLRAESWDTPIFGDLQGYGRESGKAAEEEFPVNQEGSVEKDT